MRSMALSCLSPNTQTTMPHYNNLYVETTWSKFYLQLYCKSLRSQTQYNATICYKHRCTLMGLKWVDMYTHACARTHTVNIEPAFEMCTDQCLWWNTTHDTHFLIPTDGPHKTRRQSLHVHGHIQRMSLWKSESSLQILRLRVAAYLFPQQLGRHPRTAGKCPHTLTQIVSILSGYARILQLSSQACKFKPDWNKWIPYTYLLFILPLVGK